MNKMVCILHEYKMQIGGLKLILKNIKKRYLDVSGTFPIISKGDGWEVLLSEGWASKWRCEQVDIGIPDGHRWALIGQGNYWKVEIRRLLKPTALPRDWLATNIRVWVGAYLVGPMGPWTRVWQFVEYLVKVLNSEYEEILRWVSFGWH